MENSENQNNESKDKKEEDESKSFQKSIINWEDKQDATIHQDHVKQMRSKVNEYRDQIVQQDFQQYPENLDQICETTLQLLTNYEEPTRPYVQIVALKYPNKFFELFKNIIQNCWSKDWKFKEESWNQIEKQILSNPVILEKFDRRQRFYEKISEQIALIKIDGLKRSILTRFSIKGFNKRCSWIIQNLNDLEFMDRPELQFEPLYAVEKMSGMHLNKNKLRPHDWPTNNFETMRETHKAFHKSDGYHILKTGSGNINHKRVDDVKGASSHYKFKDSNQFGQTKYLGVEKNILTDRENK